MNKSLIDTIQFYDYRTGEVKAITRRYDEELIQFEDRVTTAQARLDMAEILEKKNAEADKVLKQISSAINYLNSYSPIH